LTIDGVNLLTLTRKDRQAYFRKIQLVHQDPYTALNPAHTIFHALSVPLKIQSQLFDHNSEWVMARSTELLAMVGLDPEGTLYKYPHALSGGQRQRVVIARALTVDPTVIVADEAVSMIDVSMRLEILNLLSDLRTRLGIAIIFITHDVAAARYIANDGEICVLYRGEVMEYGKTDGVIVRPVHPYTQAMLSATPVLRGIEEPGPDRDIPVEGMENFDTLDSGCLFSPRCRHATARCREKHPDIMQWEDPLTHSIRKHACFYPVPGNVVPVPIANRML
jgi:peptide/nickel transport system ATP-binding protein